MTGGRWLVAALALLAACSRPAANAADQDRTDLYVITSLPLFFGEGFGLGFVKPDIVRVLEKQHRLVPADVPSQLPPRATLLMAQPRALPAEELVALDQWVREGGRLVLLADPMLEWPSERPIGDRLRPPMMFADTGLLAHWGLRLDAPDRRGLTYSPSDVDPVALLSPGTLVKQGEGCAIEEGGWMAICAVGKGKATIVADADFLNVEALLKAGASPANGTRLIEQLVRPAPGQ